MVTLSRLATLELLSHLFPNLVKWKHPHVPRIEKSASPA